MEYYKNNLRHLIDFNYLKLIDSHFSVKKILGDESGGNRTCNYEPNPDGMLSNIETTAPIQFVSTSPETYTPGGNTAGILRVSFWDVGQGDSILIQSPAGKNMLVDAGDTTAGSRVVTDLKARGVTSLDVAVATHAHADHIGGFQAVLSQISVAHFYDPGYSHCTSTYDGLRTTIDQKNIKYTTLTTGQTIDLDPAVQIDVLSPDGSNKGEIHDNMLVLWLSYGNTSFLLTGDMPDTLEWQIASSLKLTTVLKVGHHGSRTSSSATFLTTIKPEVVIISVGAGNSLGHPAVETLSRFQAVGAKVYRTDLAGTVTVSTDGNTYTVATDKTGSSAPVQVATTAPALTTAPAMVMTQSSVPVVDSGTNASGTATAGDITWKCKLAVKSDCNKAYHHDHYSPYEQ
jgi:beta-lactamase superfamily II metal-dependent hydrolase